MSKKLLVAAICVLLAIGTVAGWLYLNSKAVKGSKEIQNTPPAKNLPSKNLKEYSDDSGFSFSYPQDLTVDNKKGSDSATYTDLTMTSPKIPGQIAFKITDTKIKSLEDWSGGKEITLAGIPAREVKTLDGLSTAALDQEILFTIKVSPEKEEDFWLSAYQTLISSFSFEGSSETGGEVIFEGEEILE